MALDGSQLRVDLSEGERWRRTMNITVPREVVDQERSRAVQELAKKVRLPGFRGGKVPMAVVEKRFGGHVQREILDRVIGDAYKEALQQRSLRPISEGEVEDISFETGTDLTFSISFDVSPEVELGRLGGFTVVRPSVVVGEEDVEQVLARVRDQEGRWEVTSEGNPGLGDQVAVSITRLTEEGDGDPRDYEFILGDGDAIPDVEASIATLTPGTEAEFSVRFPEDFPDEERRGEEQKLRILLKERRLRVLPELDDEFAQRAGDFPTLDDLRARIREDLEKEAADQREGSVRGQLLDALVEANPFQVPESMLLQYVRSVVGGDRQELKPEQLQRAREALGDEAERAVKRILVIERVAESRNLRATEEDVDGRIEEIARSNNTEPGEVYARLQRAGRLEQLEREITEGKVFEFLKSQSTTTDAP